MPIGLPILGDWGDDESNRGVFEAGLRRRIRIVAGWLGHVEAIGRVGWPNNEDYAG